MFPVVTAVYLRFKFLTLALQTVRVLWDVTACGVDKTVQKEQLRWKVLAYYVGTDGWTDDPEYAGTTLIRNVGKFISGRGIRSEKS